jgi:3-deoxy-manno-octulosonate cytidylyltransferase (CMP-KDO synthetase)
MNKNKKIAAFIPARMASSRFPGKPLALIAGLPMIEHVRRRALLAAGIDEVYVATCDKEIHEIVRSHGGQAIMTSDKHERCTDRIEEAARSVETDMAIIVAGDEPLLLPETLNSLVRLAGEEPDVYCANLLTVIVGDDDYRSRDVVKAVLSQDGYILYFSRAEIPFFRVKNDQPVYRQTGIQLFTKDFLAKFSKLPPTPLEVAESIDFLRILGNGFRVKAAIAQAETQAVDREADIKRVEEILKRDPAQRELLQKVLKA